jgi:hypothetical protein
MPTSQKVVTQAWEGIIVVEVAHAVAVFAAEASTQEAAMAWESTAALVRDVEAQAALAGRKAWERVSRVEVESTAMLASARGEPWDKNQASGLHACVPMTSLAASTLALLPWRALGQKPSHWWCHPCCGGFCDSLLLVGPGVGRARY